MVKRDSPSCVASCDDGIRWNDEQKKKQYNKKVSVSPKCDSMKRSFEISVLTSNYLDLCSLVEYFTNDG